ncbi:hypothetical protein [Actinophytocola sp. KF-1]
MKKLATSLAEGVSHCASVHEIIAHSMIAITRAPILDFTAPRSPTSSTNERSWTVGAAILCTELLMRRSGVSITGFPSSELIAHLVHADLNSEAEHQAILQLCHDIKVTRHLLRPRPTELHAPIIYIATPISAIAHTAHSELVHLSLIAAATITKKFGWQVDLPGRYIQPGDLIEIDRQTRDEQADSALAYASGFIAICVEKGRRGMGYAVRRAEDMGAPTLLLTHGEFDGFARIYGGSISRRTELNYDDACDLVTHVTRFCSINRRQILARHSQLVHAQRAREPLKKLSLKLENTTTRSFQHKQLTPTRASYILSDPIHFVHVQTWELRELSLILNVPETYLESLLRLSDDQV